MIPQRIAIAAHPHLPEGLPVAQQVAQFLQALGVKNPAWASFFDDTLRQKVRAGEYDLLIALGGDGTMLRAGHLCAPLGLPVLGINMGHFGFLAEVNRDQWRELLPRLLTGEFWLERRMMLRAEHYRGDTLLGACNVLNEVVVCRGQFVRPIQLAARVDGYPMASYNADGLIAATPTGSTAYALAVGGPILPPTLRNILIIPVAPHLSVDRGVVLPEGAQVTIEVQTNHQAVFSVDGHAAQPMENGDQVRVFSMDLSVNFVRFQDPGYFYRNLTAYMQQNPFTSNSK